VICEPLIPDGVHTTDHRCHIPSSTQHFGRNLELAVGESRPSIRLYVFCDIELPLSGIGNGDIPIPLAAKSRADLTS
jgi:hypothetical protein